MKVTQEVRLPMVALVGRVNVGKSTLFNRLVRERRSLVEDRPGVTRDRVVAQARIEDRDVLVVDTGGLDPEAEKGIPRAIRRQVQRVVEEAAVVVFVVDARDGLLPIDREIGDVLRRAEVPVVVVANKADGPSHDLAVGEFLTLGFQQVLATSAEHRRGLVDLEVAIGRRLPDPVPRSEDHDRAPRVAIVGRPNVGKSSLLNRLVGEEHAIVSELPGTTRDSSDIRLVTTEGEVVLIDTAGLRRAGKRRDRLERGSAFMALRSIERADVVLLVIDVIDGVTDQDAKIARLVLDRGRPLVLVCNKWDAVDPAERRPEIGRQLERKLGFVPYALTCHLSARTGKGTRKLLPRALLLLAELRGVRATSEVNRVLRDAVQGHPPPLMGRRRARFFYATQVSDRPFTAIVFLNDPSLISRNYRRYLESYFRKSLGLKSAPVRLLLRPRSRVDDADEISPQVPPRSR